MLPQTSGLLSCPHGLQQALALCLQKLTTETQNVCESKTIFNLRFGSTVSISGYLARIFQFMGCSMSVYVYALILLDRVQERHANFLVTAQNLHRLTITSVTIGAKYLDDFFYKNSYYATVGGVSTVLLNQMEAELLRLLDYDCSVSPECFQAYLQRLEVYHHKTQN